MIDGQAGREKEMIYWVDIVRVVAVFLVLIGHVSGQVTGIWGQIPASQWMIANIYGSFARLSVPLFFMVSGYLLLPRREDLRRFYTRRMPKVLVPFVVWSLIYLLLSCNNNTCTAEFVANRLLFEGTSYHLWFLYSLVSIYLVLPVLRLMITPETDRKLLWYLIGLWLIFQPVLGTARRFWDLKINLGLPITGFVFFFFLGYLLGKMILSRWGVVVSTVIGLAGILVTIFGTYLLTQHTGQTDGFFYELDSLNVILASSAAFVLIKKAAESRAFTSPWLRPLTRSLAAASFGIYLIHVLILEGLKGGLSFFHLSAFTGNPLWSIPLVSALIFLLSFGIVWVLQRIPVIRQIVP